MKNFSVQYFEKKVMRTLKRYALLPNGTPVVIGLSGGSDSVCLFYLLTRFKKPLSLALFPVHVNHGLRGESAQEDAAFCMALAQKYGEKCRIFSFDCAGEAKNRGIGTEEAGRTLRYETFQTVAREAAKNFGSVTKMPPCIALAHHADDQAETVLLRILRGTGPDGLAAMAHKRETSGGYAVIRPLLDVTKEEVLAYCAAEGLPYRQDATNEMPVYPRNRVRLELIPFLEREYNPAVKSALVRLTEAAEEDRAYLEEEAKMLLERAKFSVGAFTAGDQERIRISLDRSILQKAPPALSRRALSFAFKQMGLDRDITSAHFAALHRLLETDKASAAADLPHGYFAAVSYERLLLGKRISASGTESARFSDSEQKKSKTEEWYGTLGVRVLSYAEYVKVKETESDKNKKKEKYKNNNEKICNGEKTGSVSFYFDLAGLSALSGISPEALSGAVHLCGRKAGDHIHLPFGKKKLKERLIDCKIPRHLRENVRVVALGNLILLWQGQKNDGTRLTERATVAPVTERTKNVLAVELLSRP